MAEATKAKVKPKHHKNLSNKIMAVLCGRTGSGKTYLMMEILTEPNFLDYNNLIIYTTTQEQPIYQFIKYGFANNLTKTAIRSLFEVYEETDEDEDIEEMCKEAATQKELKASSTKDSITALITDDMGSLSNPSKLPKDKKNVVIFDDCVNERDQSIQKTYYTRARHHNCACFYLTQSFYGLDGTYIRKNANIFILFELNNRNLSELLRDLSVGDREAFKQECKNAWSKDYGFIVINLDKKPSERVIPGANFFSH